MPSAGKWAVIVLAGVVAAGCADRPKVIQRVTAARRPPVSSRPWTESPQNVTYPMHRGIMATIFWVGEPPNRISVTNVASAWDDQWMEHFGGFDDPKRRHGFFPAEITPRENPFYCALPFNDFSKGRRRVDAAQIIPWATARPWKATDSMCKNRWALIRRGGHVAYAQWEDVGPFVTDDAAYVFGTAKPRNKANHGAGIDVSPAVRDALGMAGNDAVDWCFVEAAQVPDGPWTRAVTRSGIDWK